ncbi:MAG TPA: division plane positioning ATPase MipZ [Caulobacteraceae bacterium]|jgi:chromosome partitioning protein|nr:division plane positioning ATPase MipZ [Caulobacteraceae bacterium]
MGQVIVVGNEKGGAGKSTVATHLAMALIHDGAQVAVVDLDVRQRSTERLFQNRRAWAKSQNVELLWPQSHRCAEQLDDLREAIKAPADFIIIDTPGADTALSRAAHGAADLIVTPMNDSFVDFDVLGEIDPVGLAVTRPSIYAELVWEARKARAAENGRAIDWVVLRNRLAPVEARNRRRIDERLITLGRRIGFRPLGGLRDRVIYRELYPFGLTVSDLARGVRPVPVSMGYVLARQELRMLIYDLGLSGLASAAE